MHGAFAGPRSRLWDGIGVAEMEEQMDGKDYIAGCN